MRMAATLRELLTGKQQPHLEQARQLVLADEQARQEILAGIAAKDDVYRYNCFQVLYQLSEEQPESLYPEWGYFVELLDSNNSFHRSIAGQLLANLSLADTENRFEAIFDHIFALLDDAKIVPARQFAQHVGRIARAKPELRARITMCLLAVDETHHTESRKDLLKGDVIAAFDEFFADSPAQERILGFVERQLACSSPRTRKAAKAFLKRHSG